jgi:hypothetical protein
MRIAAYIFIAIGFLFIASSGYDEIRGVTHGGRRSSYPKIVTKEGAPEAFRNIMNSRWLIASLVLFAGVVVYMIDRGQEKSDPMAPDSEENINEELRQDELDEKMKKEKEQREHVE